ncbi:MAG: beta-lactamase family protein [Bacteroidetes bacterium]|nr:beta-lactamase family protein [Bacteroidota bacterium]
MKHSKQAWRLFFPLFIVLLCVQLASAFPPGDPCGKNDEVYPKAVALTDHLNQITAEQISNFYSRRHENRLDAFNGCVLVAKDGQVVYKGAFGYGNIQYKDTLTTETPFQLASVTKTFTATAILKLVEEGKIALSDPIQKFFPEFPYQGITVKLLLTHRSGLPDYIYWGKESGNSVDYLDNQALVKRFIRTKPAVRCRPDRMFMYSNTNYALLGAVIEQVTGMTYQNYMQENIFRPLGMYNTFAFDVRDSLGHCGSACYQSRWKEWNLTYSDGVMGDKGIYASVEDMMIWDKALREGKVISPEMMGEAYLPRSLDRYSFSKDKSRNYGYGWRMVKQKEGYLIYHNGNWHGCNNVFARDLNSGYTVIVLSNKANEKNYFTQPVWDIIENVKNLQNIASLQ